MLEDFAHDIFRHVDRDGEADALVAARPARKNGRVDANQLAAGVEQRSARVARIDGGIGLDEVFVIFDGKAIAPGRADDAHGRRLAHAKRVANGKCIIADFELRRIAQGNCGETGGVDFEHGDVGLRVGAN